MVLTASPDDTIRRRAAELGATVLEKPFSVSALRRSVDALIRERRS